MKPLRCAAGRLPHVARLTICWASLFLGCASTPTQLVVTIASDLPTDVEPPVAGDGVLRAVRVEICEESCADPDAPRDERAWAIGARAPGAQQRLPLSFGVAPRDPARPGAVEIVAYALRSSGAVEEILFSTTRTVTFSPGRRLAVPIFLAAGCRGRSCPLGTTCGDDGECTGRDADAGSDAALDSAHVDAAPPIEDASVFDAGLVVDAGVDAAVGCGTSGPSGLGAPRLADERGVDRGSASAVSIAADGSTLTGGLGTTAFDWDGAHSAVAAYFVSRRGVGGSPSWTTFITYDPTRRSPWAGIAQIVEHDGVVYVAAQNAEAWTTGSLTLPEHVSGTVSDSRRVGTIVMAFDAADGRPRWAHRVKTTGVTEFVGGLAVDESGAWLAVRGFGGTFGSFQIDGMPRVVERGDPTGRLHLVHLSLTGSVLDVHGFSGPPDIDVVLAGGGEVLVSFLGSTTLTGLSPPAPRASQIVVARLASSGSARWSTSIDCSAGSWALLTAGRAGRLSASASRAYLGFAANTPRSTSPCSELTVTPTTGAAQRITRPAADATVGIVPLDLCEGRWSGSVWSAAVNSSPLAAVTGLVSDARGIVATGYVGSGGVDFGLGRLPGLEMGSGTDGFLAVFDRELAPSAAVLFGGANVGPFAPDDGGEQVALGPDTLELAVSMSGDQTIEGVVVHTGGRVLHYTVP